MTENSAEPKVTDDMISQMFDIAVKAMEDTRADHKMMEFMLGVGAEGLANIMTTTIRLKTFEALALSFIASTLKKDRPDVLEVLRSSLELGEIVASQLLAAFGMMTPEDVVKLYPSVAGLGLKQTPDSEMNEELVSAKNDMVEALKQFEDGMRGKMAVGKQQLN
jgi:hypothetical protein